MNKLELTKNYYDGIAKGYPELYHKEQEKKINLIKEFLPKTGKLLDAGAGAGVLNQFLEKEIELISFDLSKELLNLNSNKKEKKILGNLCELPFENESFDFATSFTVIQDIVDFKKAIFEIKRILKPNSKAIITHLKTSKKTQDIKEIFEKKFKIIKLIEEQKDLIYVLEKQKN